MNAKLVEAVARAICQTDCTAACRTCIKYLDHARAAIAAIEAEGCAVVPVEPTARMRSEGEGAASVGFGKPYDDEAIKRVWAAMLAAAKEPT